MLFLWTINSCTLLQATFHCAQMQSLRAPLVCHLELASLQVRIEAQSMPLWCAGNTPHGQKFTWHSLESLPRPLARHLSLLPLWHWATCWPRRSGGGHCGGRGKAWLQKVQELRTGKTCIELQITWPACRLGLDPIAGELSARRVQNFLSANSSCFMDTLVHPVGGSSILAFKSFSVSLSCK